MHVLITGAGSFIGKHATVALARAGLQVTASFRSHSPVIDCMRKHLPQTDFTRLDLAREEDYVTLPKKVDAILHFAGLSAMPGVTVDEMLACNVTGTRNLIKYAGDAKVVRVVVASTLSVYGDVVDRVITEATPVRNPGVYGASKYLAERLFAAESHWLPCVALRLPGVLGAGAHRAWIPRLLDRIRSSEHVIIYNPQSMFNNAAHVCDLNNFYVKLFRGHWSGFHAFPVGAAGQMSIAAIVKMFMSTTGSRSTVTEGAPEKSAFTVSSDYAVRNFSYSPMDVETMLRQYVGESTHRSVLFPLA